MANIFLCFVLILLWPVLCIAYVIVPKSRVGQASAARSTMHDVDAVSFADRALAVHEVPLLLDQLRLLSVPTHCCHLRGVQARAVAAQTARLSLAFVCRFQKGGLGMPQSNDPLPRAMDRGPMTTAVETLILIWVIGMVWSEVKQVWEEGFVKYVFQVGAHE